MNKLQIQTKVLNKNLPKKYKELMLFHCNDSEKRVFKTIFEYLAYLEEDEFMDIKFSLETAVLLKKLGN